MQEGDHKFCFSAAFRFSFSIAFRRSSSLAVCGGAVAASVRISVQRRERDGRTSSALRS